MSIRAAGSVSERSFKAATESAAYDLGEFWAEERRTLTGKDWQVSDVRQIGIGKRGEEDASESPGTSTPAGGQQLRLATFDLVSGIDDQADERDGGTA